MFIKRFSGHFAFVVFFCFLGFAWAAEDPIRIGVPGPFTGPYAADGAIGKMGAVLAAEEINSRGGIFGRKLKLYYFDVEDLVPEKVMASAEHLCVAKKVDLVITSWVDYGVDVKAYGRYDTIYFSGASSSLSIDVYKENPKQNWNFFEYDPTEYEYSWQGWEKMMKLPYKYPNKKVFVINEDDYWSGVIKGEYIKAVNKSGWEIVGDETSSVENVEWGAILTKIRATEPAVIMYIALTPTSISAFMNQFQKNPTNSLVHMPFLPVTPEFKQLAGKNANGVIWNTILGMLPSADGQAYKERYIKKWGKSNWRRDFPPGIWDMMHHWENAVKAVGKVDDYRAIANYIEKTPYKGLCGTYIFPPETHTAVSGDDALPASFYQIQNGEDVLLYPEVYKQGKFIVPSWIKK